jgi:hypothetical protein
MINFSDVESHVDVINLEDDRPTIMFGPHIENAKDYVAPFYITLTVHDHLLHNCMLDSGASHNLMPKVIMEKLGLGNGLAASSNKILIAIIKKVLTENKKAWHVHLKYDLWEN